MYLECSKLRKLIVSHRLHYFASKSSCDMTGPAIVTCFKPHTYWNYPNKRLGCHRGTSHQKRRKEMELECGPMPNVMTALLNIGGALCESSVIPFLVLRRKVWLTPNGEMPCSNACLLYTSPSPRD